MGRDLQLEKKGSKHSNGNSRRISQYSINGDDNFEEWFSNASITEKIYYQDGKPPSFVSLLNA